MILFLLISLGFAQTEIVVKERSTGKVVAGDYGDVSVAKLKAKMMPLGVNIENLKYEITIIDKGAEIASRKAEKEARELKIKDFKDGKIDLSKKEDLIDVIKYLLEK